MLLKKLLGERPDTNFILWLDGDSLLERSFTDNKNELINNICRNAIKRL